MENKNQKESLGEGCHPIYSMGGTGALTSQEENSGTQSVANVYQ